jgi:hypothetical protein
MLKMELAVTASQVSISFNINPGLPLSTHHVQSITTSCQLKIMAMYKAKDITSVFSFNPPSQPPRQLRSSNSSLHTQKLRLGEARRLAYLHSQTPPKLLPGRGWLSKLLLFLPCLWKHAGRGRIHLPWAWLKASTDGVQKESPPARALVLANVGTLPPHSGTGRLPDCSSFPSSKKGLNFEQSSETIKSQHSHQPSYSILLSGAGRNMNTPKRPHQSLCLPFH